MKTIEDAVIELDGKMPDKHSTRQHNKNGWYILENKTLTHINDPVWFNPKEFEVEAKRLGYISGYRWGVEHPTNGKRPELADYVEVSWSSSITGVSGASRVSRLDWSVNADGDECYHVITNFKITDPRYKPADTSYLNASTQAQSLTHSEEGLTHKSVDYQEYEPVIVTGADIVGGGGGGGFAPKSEAYFPPKEPEYNWHERGELPPVGVECEVYNHTFGKNADWEACKILWSGNFLMVYSSDSHHECSANIEHLEFRPIRTEREKVIEAAVKEFHKNCMVDYSGQPFLDGIASLYNAGMLVLPPKKSDTED